MQGSSAGTCYSCTHTPATPKNPGQRHHSNSATAVHTLYSPGACAAARYYRNLARVPLHSEHTITFPVTLSSTLQIFFFHVHFPSLSQSSVHVTSTAESCALTTGYRNSTALFAVLATTSLIGGRFTGTSAIPPASSDATSIEPKERCTRAWSDIFVSVLSAADNFPHRRRPQTAHGCFLKIWIHAPRIMRNDNARNDYPDPRPSVPVSAHFKQIQNHKIRH